MLVACRSCRNWRISVTRACRAWVSGLIPVSEEELKSAQDAAQRKVKEDNLTQVKLYLEHCVADEQRLQSREIDAETQLRTEQAKLAGLQDQLDRLDQLLDTFTRKQP